MRLCADAAISSTVRWSPARTAARTERIGRFDDGMATHPTINRERIGRFDEGIGEDRLAA